MRRGETSLQGQTGAIYIAIETVAEYTEYINQTDLMQFILPPRQLQSTLVIFADKQFMWREISLAGQRAGLGVFFSGIQGCREGFSCRLTRDGV